MTSGAATVYLSVVQVNEFAFGALRAFGYTYPPPQPLRAGGGAGGGDPLPQTQKSKWGYLAPAAPPARLAGGLTRVGWLPDRPGPPGPVPVP